MHPSSSHLNTSGLFSTEDPAPPYALSATDASDQTDPSLPEGWIRQWDTKYQGYFYVDTRTHPPNTTWHHPSADAEPAPSLPSSSLETEPYLELSDIQVPNRKSLDGLQARGYSSAPYSATSLSSSDQCHGNSRALGRRELHPQITAPAATNRTKRSNLPLRTRIMMHVPASLQPFFRREPKWVRRVDKLVDRLQRQDDKLSRRAEKWTGKCERRLLRAQQHTNRIGYSIPGPSRLQ